MENNQTDKERYTHLLEETGRAGIGHILIFLGESDFFDAPASSKKHCNYKGGLCKHSLNVYDTICWQNSHVPTPFPQDSITLVSLLHDLCKVNLYGENKLKKGGISKSKPYVHREDCRGLGHGEDSLCLCLELGLQLNLDEKKAIRWHMQPFDQTGLRNQDDWNDLSTLLFLSDYFATVFLEKKAKKAEEEEND